MVPEAGATISSHLHLDAIATPTTGFSQTPQKEPSGGSRPPAHTAQAYVPFRVATAHGYSVLYTRLRVLCLDATSVYVGQQG